MSLYMIDIFNAVAIGLARGANLEDVYANLHIENEIWRGEFLFTDAEIAMAQSKVTEDDMNTRAAAASVLIAAGYDDQETYSFMRIYEDEMVSMSANSHINRKEPDFKDVLGSSLGSSPKIKDKDIHNLVALGMARGSQQEKVYDDLHKSNIFSKDAINRARARMLTQDMKARTAAASALIIAARHSDKEAYLYMTNHEKDMDSIAVNCQQVAQYVASKFKLELANIFSIEDKVEPDLISENIIEHIEKNFPGMLSQDLRFHIERTGKNINAIIKQNDREKELLQGFELEIKIGEEKRAALRSGSTAHVVNSLGQNPGITHAGTFASMLPPLLSDTSIHENALTRPASDSSSLEYLSLFLGVALLVKAGLYVAQRVRKAASSENIDDHKLKDSIRLDIGENALEKERLLSAPKRSR